MTESPDPMAATGRDHIRASHADREHVIDTLKAAFVQGRLTKDEFDQRVGQAFDSKTYAELAALSADLPAGPTRPLSQPGQTQGWSLGDEKVLEWAIASALSPLAPLAAAFLTGNQVFAAVSVILLILDLVLGLPFLMIVVGTRVEERRQERRSSGSKGQPPPPGGAVGRPAASGAAGPVTIRPRPACTPRRRRGGAVGRPAASGAAGPVTIRPRPACTPTRHAPTCELTSRALALGSPARCGMASSRPDQRLAASRCARCL